MAAPEDRSGAAGQSVENKSAVHAGHAQDRADREHARAELQRLNAELELRVAERTAQLTAANEALAESERRFFDILATMDDVLRDPLGAVWITPATSPSVMSLMAAPDLRVATRRSPMPMLLAVSALLALSYFGLQLVMRNKKKLAGTDIPAIDVIAQRRIGQRREREARHHVEQQEAEQDRRLGETHPYLNRPAEPIRQRGHEGVVHAGAFS